MAKKKVESAASALAGKGKDYLKILHAMEKERQASGMTLSNEQLVFIAKFCAECGG